MKRTTLALILILALLNSLVIGVQTVKAQYTENGEGCPLVSGIGITSPSNTTYSSHLLTLNITIESLFDSSIYNYVFVYSIDGKNNLTIPATSYSFTSPSNNGPLASTGLTAYTSLPQLDDGPHSLTVYATYERISTNTNWPALIWDNNTVYFTINDGISPAITNLSIINGTYKQNNLTLSFTTDKAVSWIGYSLDGKANITIAGNKTLTTIANGEHSLTIYANDTLGNMGSSKTIYFEIESTTEMFPTTWILIGVVAAAIVSGVGLLVYFKKHKH